MTNFDRPSRWDDLLTEAYNIIDHVNREHTILDSWTFGGGTAMMLQIDHRESHDVDLFLDDPQLLPYLTAAVSDLEFRLGEPSYGGDGSMHLKIAFDGVGEIDFIVAGLVSEFGKTASTVLGREIQMETVAEIVAKKIRFRGSYIQARDVFDIAAACEAGHEDAINDALAQIPEYKAAASKQLSSLNPEYVDSIIAQLMIKPSFKPVADHAREIAMNVLSR